jgi:hypothetical protein
VSQERTEPKTVSSIASITASMPLTERAGGLSGEKSVLVAAAAMVVVQNKSKLK